MKSLFHIVVILFLVSSVLIAQETKKIDFDAGMIEFNEKMDRDAKRLKGNVVFRHEGAIMYCDSADFYSKKNSLVAYNNVHIKQGDSLNLYGQHLVYDGNTKIAVIKRNVKLTQDKAYLLTDSLIYDRNKGVAFFICGGEMVDSVNHLVCDKGYYYTVKKDFFGYSNVVLTNPDYVMNCDTLRYNTASEISFFYGPTEIVSDTNFIYCENGWYNTRTDIAQFNKNAYLENKKQRLSGDSLYYERHHRSGGGFGEAFMNVVLLDTLDDVVLRGNYGYYYEEPERALLVDSAYATHIFEDDSIFLHADTLRSVYDSSGSYKIIKAYYRAKMYKTDFQGMCDSMVYSFRDSIVELHYDPVLWSQDNQITADYIELHTDDGKLDKVYMKLNAMVVSEQDSIRFNQIKGKNMVGHFRQDSLYRIDVNGNGETVYFATDSEGLVGANIAKGSTMVIHMADNEVEQIILNTTPDGQMNPINSMPESDLRLKGFHWLVRHRPLSMVDIFKWENDGKSRANRASAKESVKG